MNLILQAIKAMFRKSIATMKKSIATTADELRGEIKAVQDGAVSTLVVTVDDAGHATHTSAEICAAAFSGKRVVLTYTDKDAGITFRCETITTLVKHKVEFLSNLSFSTNSVSISCASIDETGNLTIRGRNVALDGHTH